MNFNFFRQNFDWEEKDFYRTITRTLLIYFFLSLYFIFSHNRTLFLSLSHTQMNTLSLCLSLSLSHTQYTNLYLPTTESSFFCYIFSAISLPNNGRSNLKFQKLTKNGKVSLVSNNGLPKQGITKTKKQMLSKRKNNQMLNFNFSIVKKLRRIFFDLNYKMVSRCSLMVRFVLFITLLFHQEFSEIRDLWL